MTTRELIETLKQLDPGGYRKVQLTGLCYERTIDEDDYEVSYKWVEGETITYFEVKGFPPTEAKPITIEALS